MPEDPEGRVILAEGLIARSGPVDGRDYDVTRRMARRAEAAGLLLR